MVRFAKTISAVAAICLLPAINGVAGPAQPYEFTIRYAVALDDAEPFSGEVTCRSDRDCELVDHKKPDIRLHLPRPPTADTFRTLSVACAPRRCLLWPERPIITPRQTSTLARIELAEGEDLGFGAVLRARKRIGEIFIAY